MLWAQNMLRTKTCVGAAQNRRAAGGQRISCGSRFCVANKGEIPMMCHIPSLGSGASRVAQRLARFFFLLTLGFAGGVSATLIDRGNGLIYDDVLNITWVQDADLCLTLGDCVNGDASGEMTWDDANTWAANLVYQGFSDWR